MENENPEPVFALTKEHDEIAQSIYTAAGVCQTKEGENLESLHQEESRIRWTKALWDTGATNTCISDRLALELSLNDEDFVKIATAAGVVRVPVYYIHLFLPNRQVFHEIQVVQFTYTDDDCDVIIGMDIITQGDLALTNQEGHTVFSFRIPSLHTVDFEAGHSG